MAPQDNGLRMNVAQIYLRDAEPDMARWVLKPLAYDPHNREIAKAAVELIKQIDAKYPPVGPGEPKKDEKPAAG